ncbi:uncharacterized protein LOC125036203 [Penaeus chinensis]|uniref:uncharacterized protein LOC125036203 n=1 Tax=Penaeus chinensis TaxID=139456 RepID=UPI001FB790D3|nr:uncharacterized protein LOC125036203 [Penaeus chinensis]
MENSQKTYDDLFTPPPKGLAQKRLRMQQSQQFLEPESEEQDPGLPAAFQRSPKENGDVGGAADAKDDSKDDPATAAGTAADPPRPPSGSGGRPRVAFPERYAAVVKQVHEGLDATFQEQYDNLCQLQQEEDAVMERMQKLRAEARAANSGIEQQVSRIVGRMKTALDRIQRSMV